MVADETCARTTKNYFNDTMTCPGNIILITPPYMHIHMSLSERIGNVIGLCGWLGGRI
jgi:hypothetical protein